MTQQAVIHTALHQLKAKHARELLHDLDPSQSIHPARLAVINMKKWETGSTLKYRFREGSPVQQERVKQKAKIWEKYANITIDFVDTNEQVRIAFASGQGSWSAVGTDALVESYFPKHEPTMNFGWLTDDTADTEYERVVVHEFGHALGCIHEHQAPTEQLKWDKEAVYQYFSGAPNYWKKKDIDSNILEKYSPKGITATIFDKKSIMLYQFPAFLFTDRHGTPTNTHLSSKDEQLIAQMYPPS